MNTPTELPPNEVEPENRQGIISKSVQVVGKFITKKVRGIIEYRPTLKDTMATVGVLATAGVCMYIEDRLTTDFTEKDEPSLETTIPTTTSPSTTTTIFIETNE